jgi:competence protein ComGB
LVLFSVSHLSSLVFAFLIFFLLLLHFLICFRRVSADKKLRLLISIPVVRSFIRLYCTYHLTFYLGSLLQSGLSMLKALEAMSGRGAASFISFEAGQMSARLRNGEAIEAVVAGRPWYLPDLVLLIRRGQAGGSLGQTLSQFSGIVLEHMDKKMRALLAFCQPVLLVLVGMLVLILFLSILLPVFNIVNGL